MICFVEGENDALYLIDLMAECQSDASFDSIEISSQLWKMKGERRSHLDIHHWTDTRGQMDPSTKGVEESGKTCLGKDLSHRSTIKMSALYNCGKVLTESQP